MKRLMFLIPLYVFSLDSIAQCPVPTTCTYTAVNGTNYTVNAGETLCMPSPLNYNSGTITLNGGTLYVASGATLSRTISANSTSIINNCGTLNTTFNNSLTINNYANNATISYVIDNGVNFNNYATGVTLNVNTGNPNNAVRITNSSGASITVVTNTNNTNCSSSLGNSTTITNNGDMTFPNSLCMKAGTITNTKNLTFSNQLAMDGGTLESKFGSTTSITTLRKNNGSVNVYDGSVLSINSIINYDGNSIRMMDAGCSFISLATPPSSSFNNNLIDNGANVSPYGINYCGGVPRNAASSGNTISAVANAAGVYRVTLSSGVNAPNTGDFVYITGVTGGTLNGYWKVTKISNYVYDLIGSVYAPVTSLTGNYMYTNNLKFGNGNYLGESGCANPCIPLPVVFTYFNIYRNGSNSSVINYGVNISYDACIIQSSLDGQNFTDVNVETTQLKNVSYTTTGEYGNVYYRIKCVVGNTAYYSQIKANQSKQDHYVEVYPNPTNDGVVNITWKYFDLNETDAQVSILIYDAKGSFVKTITVDDYKQNNFLLEIPKGVYLIEIVGNNLYEVFKVISL